jgi:hypothetical protein
MSGARPAANADWRTRVEYVLSQDAPKGYSTGLAQALKMANAKLTRTWIAPGS